MSAKPQRGSPRARVLCAALVAALTMLAAAPLPQAWDHWRYSRGIELPPTDTKQLVSVVAPLDMYSHAKPWLGDVRVIDDQGAEVPFMIFRQAGTSHTASLPSTLGENSFTEGKFTQLVVDLGAHAPFHNALRIETSSQDFIEWVQVEASDDGHVWRMVQERTPIFRFRKDGHEGTQVVRYSENNAQYLRIRILDGDAKFPVSGVNELHEVVEPAERVPMEIALAPDAKQQAGRSVWSADVGPAAALVSEVLFDVTSPAEFIRSVNVSSSADGKDWFGVCGGEIYRYRREEAQLEQLSVPVPHGAPQRRYLRVEIANGNDAPLTDGAPRLYITPQHIVFEQQPGRSYSLIYGQERAVAAQYDLRRRVEARRMAAMAVAGQTGAEEVNTDWVDPRAWTETHDMFLWLVMLAAVLLIGYAAVRSLRKSARVPEA
ncbi:MAG: DUF3999 family protein [Candidatus Acidiferrales bacterium]